MMALLWISIYLLCGVFVAGLAKSILDRKLTDDEWLSCIVGWPAVIVYNLGIWIAEKMKGKKDV